MERFWVCPTAHVATRQRPAELMQIKCKVNSWPKLINGATYVEFLGRRVQLTGEFQPWKPRFLSARSAEINKRPRCRSLCASAETVPLVPNCRCRTAELCNKWKERRLFPGKQFALGGGLEAVLFLSPAVLLLASVAPDWSGSLRQWFTPDD